MSLVARDPPDVIGGVLVSPVSKISKNARVAVISNSIAHWAQLITLYLVGGGCGPVRVCGRYLWPSDRALARPDKAFER